MDAPAMLKTLWPTPMAPALSCAEVATKLGVAAGRLLARLKTAGLIDSRSAAKNDTQRDAGRQWDTTDKGDAVVAAIGNLWSDGTPIYRRAKSS